MVVTVIGKQDSADAVLDFRGFPAITAQWDISIILSVKVSAIISFKDINHPRELSENSIEGLHV